MGARSGPSTRDAAKPESEMSDSAVAPHPSAGGSELRYALIGNPNTGKTTLFNRLCGVRARTANYPGITVDARTGYLHHDAASYSIIDLPGVYSLHLDLPEAELCRRILQGERTGRPRPDAVLIIADATNLVRNLVLVSEVVELGVPAVLALSMMDRARSEGLVVDTSALGVRLGIPVVEVNARNGAALDGLLGALSRPATAPPLHAGGSIAERTAWADRIAAACTRDGASAGRRPTWTDRFDLVATHPISGGLLFLAVMGLLFGAIFWLADLPMTWIETLFGALSRLAASVLPDGLIGQFIAGGLINGVAGTVVFLPQICFLFFLLSLLEDTGYLARAAFIADRLMRRFGLPGQAFVPLLSSHACAIPGILCARLIPDRRDRLATILVAPFMSCSARLPVYSLLVGFLFHDRPYYAGFAFFGCYLLGACAALGSAILVRRTLLPGAPRPMILELPSYKRPSLRTALFTTLDRARSFLRNAGTVIVAICVVIWWLSTYPLSPRSEEVLALEERALAAAPAEAEEIRATAENLHAREGLANSYAGRLGRFVEPALEPLGYDWRLSISVLTSFLAREVFVSSLTVILGTGGDAEGERIREAVVSARRDGGALLLDNATAVSLLIFYVLAMQCLPTLAVTRRESGAWRWAALQFGYMSAVAYVAAFVSFQGLRALGVS